MQLSPYYIWHSFTYFKQQAMTLWEICMCKALYISMVPDTIPHWNNGCTKSITCGKRKCTVLQTRVGWLLIQLKTFCQLVYADVICFIIFSVHITFWLDRCTPVFFEWCVSVHSHTTVTTDSQICKGIDHTCIIWSKWCLCNRIRLKYLVNN